jgi:hypothetical protein
LSGLDHPTAVSLIKQVVGERELPREVIDRIIVHGDNVPLFIEELTKTVLKRLQDRHGEHASPLQPLSADVVPTSLYSSLMERLDRSSAGKEIAQIGAVIGREFSFDMIQALSPLPAKQLENVLTELTQAGIIVAHGQPPDATYTFKHALVQDAAYASLLRDRRHAIHLRLAEEMEKDATIEATELPLIAWHFAEARAPDKAIDYYQKAAEHATGRFALTEIVNHLQNGLRQITLLPESAARNRRELALQLALGRALIDQAGGASDAVRVTFERARALCFSLDEMTLLPRAYDGLIANYHYIRSNPEQILKYAAEIISVHSRTGDPQALVMLKRAGALANFLLGRFESAREDMQALIDMYDARRDGPEAGTTTRDPKVAMMTFLGVCLSILGHFDSGAAKTRAGIDYAKTLNHPVSLNLALRRACVQGMLLKDTQQVAECSNELAALRAAYETYQGGWEGTFFQDWAQLRIRSDPVRLDRVRAFLEHLDRASIWALLPFYMASVAELIGQHGDGAAAAALVERADELMNIGGGRWCYAEVTRLRARFCTRDPEEAAAFLNAGLVKAREQNAKLWELRTATDLAALLRDQGNFGYACEVLRPVYEWFSEGKDASDHIATRALLNDIEQRRRRAASSESNTLN